MHTLPHIKAVINLATSIGGSIGGTALVVAKTLHPYYSGILFLMAAGAYALSMYASWCHIKSIKRKHKK